MNTPVSPLDPNTGFACVEERDDEMTEQIVALLNAAVVLRVVTPEESLAQCLICLKWDDAHAEECPVPALETWLATRYPADVVVFHIVCAWCQTVVRQGSNPTPETTSHGLCPSCQIHIEKDLLD